jgi:hypothetical protein
MLVTAILLRLLSLALTRSVSAAQLSTFQVQPVKLVLMEKAVSAQKGTIGTLEKLIASVILLKITLWILMATVKSATMFL